MDEVKAIQTIATALETLGDEERGRVLAWAQSKYGNGLIIPPPATAKAAQAIENDASPKTSSSNVLSGVAKPKSRRTKTIISMDKSLNLNPQGKQSATSFAASKAPSNVKEKCVVAVYYLRDVLEMPKVNTQAVFTFFKFVQWPIPADLKNTLAQAGTAGWLDTADGEDIKLTGLGENRVEHDLPPKPKAKA